MSQNNYIETFALIETTCTEIGTRAYLWGGWIPDVYSGEVLRQHDDAEYFVVDLYKYRSKLQKIFSGLNWETKVVENGDLVIKKAGMKFQFGHLEVNDKEAIWFHNGTKGQIIFPKQWLNDNQIVFQKMKFHAVLPEFQYVLKLHPEFMNPDWTKRNKDKKDIRALQKLLF